MGKGVEERNRFPGGSNLPIERAGTIAERAACGLIRAYQITLSPFVGRQCRFYPTCSHYALGAIHTYGAGRGLVLTLKRLLRCHPWHPGGFDPVPGCNHQKHTN